MNIWQNLKRFFITRKGILIILLFLTMTFLFLNSPFLTVLTFVISVLVMLTFKDFRTGLRDSFGIISAVLILFFTVIFWISGKQITLGGFSLLITNDHMLVILTFFYVLLTYFILSNSSQQFGLSRLPSISCLMSYNSLSIKNLSPNFNADDVEVIVRLIYPLPKKVFEKIKSNIKMFFGRFSGFETLYVISEIPPGESKIIDLFDFLSRHFKFKKESDGYGYEYITAEKNVDYEIEVSIEYKSDTGVFSPKLIVNKFYFTFHNGQSSVERISEKIKKIY
jgi:hypothetical protein